MRIDFRIRRAIGSVAAISGLAVAIAFTAHAMTGKSGIADPSGDGNVYWSDGDSGRLPDGTKFRLHGVDAPETRSMKQVGGAECEIERERGYVAKERVIELTRGKQVAVTRDYGRDRYKRLVVDISIDGRDLATQLIREGTHQVWDYDGGARKPDWCGPRWTPAAYAPASP